mmetsp:Transcript_18834/g.35024  ORF Transcript_18834/g.35024 Transcript_18834/m.35024 type:complete len:194 (+) Transcript_18834:489-1070(+)
MTQVTNNNNNNYQQSEPWGNPTNTNFGSSSLGTGTCGNGNRGNGQCPLTTECCSQYGHCGTSTEHCASFSNGMGMNANPPSTGGAAPSIFGTCGGGQIGNGICSNNAECCSEFGFCGVSRVHCENKVGNLGPNVGSSGSGGTGGYGGGSSNNVPSMMMTQQSSPGATPQYNQQGVLVPASPPQQQQQQQLPKN